MTRRAAPRSARDGASDLRALPRIDDCMRAAQSSPQLAVAPRELVRAAARAVVEDLRAQVRAGLPRVELERATAAPALLERMTAEVLRGREHSLAPAVNATGVVLHTGLGRAPLAASAAAAAAAAAQACALEIDRASGERGRRDHAVGRLLSEITGAADATAVNNNAAATLLAVNTFALGREVVVSRGELVEIGGAFRMPEVVARGGARLVEVGTTNRTRAADYRDAVTERTGLLMKVHTSNYRVNGFTEEATLEELIALGRERGIPVVHDLGSGLLRRALAPALAEEPTVADSVAAGPDLTLFSGDKLLGGPQAGCIVGTPEAVGAVRVNPMFRAMRLDKLILAALEATLRLHAEGGGAQSVPALARLNLEPDALRARAAALARAIGGAKCSGLAAELVASSSEAGSGSAPTVQLPTTCVALSHASLRADELSRRLRMATPAVFARVREDRVLLDPRTLGDGDDERIVAALHHSLRSGST